jgi:hypothetical protein
MDHRDFGYTKKKKKKHNCCACMHAKQQERRAQNERSSERAHFVGPKRAIERASALLCDVYKFGLEQECGEDAAGRARVSTILSFCLLVRTERYLRTAPHRFYEMLLFATSFSTSRSGVLRLPRICYYSRSKAKQRKEMKYINFHVNNFLAVS